MRAALTRLERFVPILTWLPAYRRQDLSGDMMAGLIVAIMLVPQGMAYAMLAGLPPQVGLYASILPPLIYAFFGSSRALAVGPVAMVSLMVASTVGEIAAPGSANYIAVALLLALLSGVILFVMGLARLGFLVNFLSHPVIAGFTSAAALVIGFSQFKHLLGIDIPRSHLITDIVGSAVEQFADINPATAGLGFGAVTILLLFRLSLAPLLRRAGLSELFVNAITKAGPLVVVVFGTAIVSAAGLAEFSRVSIVGVIPTGLPSVVAPVIDRALIAELLPAALLISFVGFVESVSVAKSLASRRRQHVDANNELTALGLSNIGAAFTGGYPVTGGFSRSVVNFSAGANTGLASMITAVLVALTVGFLTPLLHDLPKAVLAAIIIVAVAGLVDIAGLIRIWRYNRLDGLSFVATFLAVLAIGVELGIMAGAGLSILLYLWRTSQPHMAEVGRVGDSEHFRNIKRHTVNTKPAVLALRVDENLYFANSRYLEDHILAAIAGRPQINHLVLICSAVNFIDASALETLEHLIDRLRAGGVTLHLAEVKGPVMDQLERSNLLEELGEGRVFLSTHAAMQALA